jgi:tetrahydromethanopterin S-methyltransferase subunit G
MTEESLEQIDAAVEQPSVLDPELQREVDRARRDIKLVGYVSIGLIGLMIVFTLVAVLLAYGD